MFGVLCLSSCSSDLLETEPTDKMSGSTFMSDATKALIPLNGIYRSMYTAGWSTTSNTHQCFGISAYNLMGEVMGDDFIMGAQGSAPAAHGAAMTCGWPTTPGLLTLTISSLPRRPWKAPARMLAT